MSKRPLEAGTPSRPKVFRIGPELEARLMRLARKEETTPSEIIRRALDSYLDYKLGVIT
jgi:predicted transcriptional regulator